MLHVHLGHRRPMIIKGGYTCRSSPYNHFLVLSTFFSFRGVISYLNYVDICLSVSTKQIKIMQSICLMVHNKFLSKCVSKQIEK